MTPGDIGQWIGVFLLFSALFAIYHEAGPSPELTLTGASVFFTVVTKIKHEVECKDKERGDKP